MSFSWFRIFSFVLLSMVMCLITMFFFGKDPTIAFITIIGLGAGYAFGVIQGLLSYRKEIKQVLDTVELNKCRHCQKELF